jgi:hypothetical protein
MPAHDIWVQLSEIAPDKWTIVTSGTCPDDVFVQPGDDSPISI